MEEAGLVHELGALSHFTVDVTDISSVSFPSFPSDVSGPHDFKMAAMTHCLPFAKTVPKRINEDMKGVLAVSDM